MFDQIFYGEQSFKDRLELATEIPSNFKYLIHLDQVALAWGVLAKWFQYSKQNELRDVALYHYRELSNKISHGSSHNLFCLELPQMPS